MRVRREVEGLAWPLGDTLPRPLWTGGPLIVTFSPAPPKAVSQLSIVEAMKQGISRKTRNAWVTWLTSWRDGHGGDSNKS